MQDAKLSFFLEWASGLIEQVLDRDLSWKVRTQYFKGTNTQRLTLKARPAFPALSTPQAMAVYQDDNAWWGSSPSAFDPTTSLLTYGTDYCLEIDQDDGSSRCGILWRINDLWRRPQLRSTGLLTPYVGDGRGTIKVTYLAGYTLDTLPAAFRMASDYLVAKMRQVFPLGFMLTSESYEERAVSYWTPERRKWLAEIWPFISSYKNWHW